MRYGSIPAGGLGTRLQPIGFSKELVPVAGRAVIEYLIDRMVLAGIEKIFINTAEDKTDLIRYLSTKSPHAEKLIFLVRPRRGLLDGIVLPEQFLREDDTLYFGLPDTIWYPTDAFAQLDKLKGDLVLGLFDTGTPERFDSVVIDAKNRIQSIEVKVKNPKTKWTWAIGRMTVATARSLPQRSLFGESLNVYSQKNPAYAVELAESSCLDVGTLDDYHQANMFVKDHEK